MQHPSGLQEPVKRVLGDAVARIKAGRIIKDEFQIEIGETFNPHRLAVAQEPMAILLALRPIAAVMQANGPDRAAHANQRAKVDHGAFQPERAFETAVD